VGTGIVQRFLQDGATVVAPLRSAASKPRLADHLTAPTDKLHTPVADWSTPEGAAALAQFIKEQQLQVDHAVSISGERQHVRLVPCCKDPAAAPEV
jgi:NAD(P)-dependent dehydrogenase (short-subunit alcohol dehydrogenase family)